jgi:hypothetical protein
MRLLVITIVGMGLAMLTIELALVNGHKLRQGKSVPIAVPELILPQGTLVRSPDQVGTESLEVQLWRRYGSEKRLDHKRKLLIQLAAIPSLSVTDRLRLVAESEVEPTLRQMASGLLTNRK